MTPFVPARQHFHNRPAEESWRIHRRLRRGMRLRKAALEVQQGNALGTDQGNCRVPLRRTTADPKSSPSRSEVPTVGRRN